MQYYIEYWLNGGKLDKPPITSISVESGIVLLPSPAKEGEEFLGWYADCSYGGERVYEIECQKQNVSLYAKWSDVVYTVKYDLCGGLLYEYNPESYRKSDEFVLNEPVRKGYIFLGWYDTSNGGDQI